jgi:DNA invertase Pin-like site-specific DNA recombinase
MLGVFAEFERSIIQERVRFFTRIAASAMGEFERQLPTWS